MKNKLLQSIELLKRYLPYSEDYEWIEMKIDELQFQIKLLEDQENEKE